MAAADELQGIFRELEAFPAVITEKLGEVVSEAAREAQTRAPERTGKLARGVYATRSANGQEFVLGATAPYAPYVLYGTRKMRQNPFLAVSLARQLRLLTEQLARRWSSR